MNNKLQDLEHKISYEFKNKKLLKRALTHSSYSNESGGTVGDYERLEFLGDAVLELVITEYLFKNFPNKSEGELSKLRSSVVCESSLFSIGKSLDLGHIMKFGKGEKNTGGANRPSIIADAVESLIAAIFMDSDFHTVKEIILRLFKESVRLASEGLLFDDYKSEILEYFQSKAVNDIRYKLVSSSGPDHEKIFTSELVVAGKVLALGVGRTKKASEQEAAKTAYLKIKDV